MKKSQVVIPPEAKVHSIPNTSYVIINNKYVARLLTPSVKNGKTYYSLTIKGESNQELIDDLNKLASKK
jgi:hypothetical protein